VSQTIGNLATILSASDQGFSVLMDSAAEKLRKVNKATESAGAATGKGGLFSNLGSVAGGGLITGAIQGGLSSLTSLVEHSFESVAALGHLSDRLGTSTELIQSLHLVAEQAGVGVEELDISLERLNRRLGEAQTKAGQTDAVMTQLGITQEEIAGLNFEQFLGIVADRFQAMGDSAQKAYLAQELFGRGGVRLVGFLSQGRAGIEAARHELEALGISISRMDATRVEKAQAALAKMKMILEGIGQQIAIELAPLIEGAAEKFSDWVKQAGGVKNIILPVIDSIVLGFASLIDQLTEVRNVFRELANDFAKAKNWWGTPLKVGNLEIPFIRKIGEGKGIDFDEMARNNPDSAVAAAKRFLDRAHQNFGPRIPNVEGPMPPPAAAPLPDTAGLLKWFEGMEKSLGNANSKAPDAMMQGSREAISAITQASRHRETVQERVERVLKESYTLQQRQAETEKQILRALEKAGITPVVKMPP
jgi:hypothetical protein